MAYGFLDFPIQLALAVVAGLLLNLMPCVLPAIPIKIRTIVNEAGSRPRQRFLAAVAFLVGSLLFFMPLAAATVALQWSWGTAFQSTGLLLLLIAVLLLFAYTTYRGVQIPVPQFAYQMRGRRYIEPFLSGFFGALLATPCVGPFLGGVLAFSLTQPPAWTFIIFAAIALGLSLPYIILLAYPQGLNCLPKAGEWLERVRQSLAFVLLGAAIFFAQSLLSQTLTHILWGGWFALLVVWGVWVAVRSAPKSAKGVGPAVVALGAVFMVFSGLVPIGASASLEWHELNEASWQQANQSNNPILVEYTADWCINCKVLERTVFDEPEVAAAVDKAGMQTLQGDLTHSDSWLEQLLGDLGGTGLPFAAVMDDDGEVLAKFSGMFTKSQLIKAIQSAGH